MEEGKCFISPPASGTNDLNVNYSAPLTYNQTSIDGNKQQFSYQPQNSTVVVSNTNPQSSQSQVAPVMVSRLPDKIENEKCYDWKCIIAISFLVLFIGGIIVLAIFVQRKNGKL